MPIGFAPWAASYPRRRGMVVMIYQQRNYSAMTICGIALYKRRLLLLHVCIFVCISPEKNTVCVPIDYSHNMSEAHIKVGKVGVFIYNDELFLKQTCENISEEWINLKLENCFLEHKTLRLTPPVFVRQLALPERWSKTLWSAGSQMWDTSRLRCFLLIQR